MPQRSTTHKFRLSRPPSLSTIGSNEEADFTSGQHQQHTYNHHSATHYQDRRISSAPSVVSVISDRDRAYRSFSPVSPEPPVTTFEHINNHNLPRRPSQIFGRGSRSITNQFPTTMLQYPEKTADVSSTMILDPIERAPSSLSDVESNVKVMKTRYMWMLLQLDHIPVWHNVLAAVSSWIILAAYLVVPGTFTSLQQSKALDVPNNPNQSQIDQFAHNLLHSVNNLPLLAISGILAGLGAFSCIFLWVLHWKNFIWVSSKIFTPMMMNAFAGLLTTIVNVYTAQKGTWSVTAKLNAIITGSTAGTAMALFCLYNFWLIADVKRDHRRLFPQDAELVDPMKKRKGTARLEKWFPGE